MGATSGSLSKEVIGELIDSEATSLSSLHAWRYAYQVSHGTGLKKNYKQSMYRHHLVLVLWTIGTNALKTTNLRRNISRNSMNYSSDAVPSIRKGKLKLFIDSEPALKVTYELNC